MIICTENPTVLRIHIFFVFVAHIYYIDIVCVCVYGVCVVRARVCVGGACV